MWIKRSRYDNVLRELEGQLNEIEGLRKQLAESMDKGKKQEKSIGILYNEAKVNADAKSVLGGKLKEAQLALTQQDVSEHESFIKNFDIRDYVEPSPTDADQRALYISKITGYFNGGLTDYLNYLIAGFKAEVSRFPLTEREADFYRSAINVCHILNEWGVETVKEHHANARGEEATENVFDEPDEEEIEAVENIKKSVNKE